VIKDIKVRSEYQELLIVFIMLSYIIHVAGCLWYASHYGDVKNYTNWITSNEIKDESIPVKYIYSLYWATVTCTTVGYGDLLPTNGFEFIWAMFIMCFGVAIFSYYLSDLSSKFSELVKSSTVGTSKMNQIEKLRKIYEIEGKLYD
jgi:hypothetical protein